ncbi:CPBP family intramembrane glutamic endopeptidase [Hydrogenophaga sp. RWCD_12]|uniref:CPBP family intramembrane glutamic endopeptidase n=1 Tax=Hydrogenophaga sp. RWCD_12 TaxID=3391190 RepID=UPI0039851820
MRFRGPETGLLDESLNAAGRGSGPDPLDRRAPVWGVLLVAFVLLGWGEIRATDPYTSPAFVVGYFWTELQVSALLLVATALFWPRQRLGLSAPRPAPLRYLAPLALLVAAAVAVRIWVATQIPVDAAPDAATSWKLLRTTLVVGLNEEWLFRGLALAAFCRWWGWRRGWLAALLAFACVHLLNLIGGVPPIGAVFQFVNTFLMGSVFLLVAVNTRSLLLPMLGHAVYDWSVVDTVRYVAAGAPNTASLTLSVFALLLGLFSLWTLWRTPALAPYTD